MKRSRICRLLQRLSLPLFPLLPPLFPPLEAFSLFIVFHSCPPLLDDWPFGAFHFEQVFPSESIQIAGPRVYQQTSPLWQDRACGRSVGLQKDCRYG